MTFVGGGGGSRVDVVSDKYRNDGGFYASLYDAVNM
jgi:hypothetical protein